jgi:hypothetical protein
MGIKTAIANIFTGGVGETVKVGAEIVEKWFPGAEKKAEIAADIDASIAQTTQSARDHDARIGNVPGIFNNFVNGVNRCIRPAVTVGLVGGVVGIWPLPATDSIDPIILGYTEIVLIFWFGGRALFKDLPSLIAYVKARK